MPNLYINKERRQNFLPPFPLSESICNPHFPKNFFTVITNFDHCFS